MESTCPEDPLDPLDQKATAARRHDSWETAIPIELGFGCCHDLKHQVIEDDRRVLVVWSLLSLWQETADDSYAARKLQRF